MKTETLHKILDVQDALLLDQRYRERYEEYTIYSQRFVRLQNELTPEQNKVLGDYLGVCAEMHLRMLELACEE